MVNEIVSLISLSALSLLVYMNTRDFYILILYPSTLPKPLMSCRSFLIASLGFSMYSTMSSANSECFTCLFPTWIFVFTSFPSLIDVVRKSTLNIHWKDWCWSWNSNTLAIWWDKPTHWERTWCWERLWAREEGNREWDGWMALPNQWTCVWAISGR